MKTVVFSYCSNLCSFPDGVASVYLFTLGQWWWTLSARAESKILQNTGCRLGGASLFACFPYWPIPVSLFFPVHVIGLLLLSDTSYVTSAILTAGCCEAQPLEIASWVTEFHHHCPQRGKSPQWELSVPWVPGQLKEGGTQRSLISRPRKGLPSLSRREGKYCERG